MHILGVNSVDSVAIVLNTLAERCGRGGAIRPRSRARRRRSPAAARGAACRRRSLGARAWRPRRRLSAALAWRPRLAPVAAVPWKPSALSEPTCLSWQSTSPSAMEASVRLRASAPQSPGEDRSLLRLRGTLLHRLLFRRRAGVDGSGYEASACLRRRRRPPVLPTLSSTVRSGKVARTSRRPPSAST